jgi:magnesium chelatase subunit I
MGTVKNLNNFPFAHYRPRRDEISSQLNVIDPKIGGVMIMGDRGTGKSTTIRALAFITDITIKRPLQYRSKRFGKNYETEEVKIPW